MGGSDDPLREDDIDNEEQDDACSDEDLRGDSEGDVLRASSPGDAQGHSHTT